MLAIYMIVIVILSKSQSTIRIPPRDHPHAFPADLEAPVHTSQFAHTRGIPVGVQKTAYTLVGLFREVRNHIHILIGTIRPSSTIKVYREMEVLPHCSFENALHIR